ncbi:MAG: adenylate kinase [Candidatus Micrarchaeota archaeon]
MRIVILGPPGSGKGTAAQQLSKKHGIPHISTGEILRKAISEQTELGKKIAPVINSGKLIPDDLMVDVIRSRLSADDCQEGFLLDGFPRTVTQAEALDGLLAEINLELDAVVNLIVPDDEVIRRLSKRQTCIQCGTIYAADYTKDVCDKCGGRLGIRQDDKPEVVGERLKVYEKQTSPLVKYYREKDLIIEVNGIGSPEEVFRQVEQVIKGKD